MFAEVPLFPQQASTIAPEVDGVTGLLTAISAFFTLLIATLIICFAIKYRRRHPDEYPRPVIESTQLELVWTIIPLLIVLGIFTVGTRVHLRQVIPPDDTLDIYIIGRQWMWNMQHLGGQRENQELHVPVGRAVKLVMTSQDVIHNFSIPEFRVKMDVIPGRYTTLWFQATRPGKYRFFCAEYCGTDHSRMVGWVHVMEPEAFQAWLASPRVEGSPASEGRKLFLKLQCVTCHSNDALARGPNLEGLYGQEVPLEGGGKAHVDESYYRRAVLEPDRDVRLGFRPIMPSFKGQVSEEELMRLVAFLRFLGPGQTPPRTERADAPR